MQHPLLGLLIALLAATLVQSFPDLPDYASRRAISLIASYQKEDDGNMLIANNRLQKARQQLIEKTLSPLYPLQTFLTNKGRMTKAYNDGDDNVTLAQDYHNDIPKGAHLHIHYNAVLAGELVWKIAVDDEETKIKNAWIQFDFLENQSQDKCKNLKDKAYFECMVPKSAMSINLKGELRPAKGGTYPPQYALDEVLKEVGSDYLRDQYLDNQMKFPDWSSSSELGDLDVRAQRMWNRFNTLGTPLWKNFFMHESVLEAYTKQLIEIGLKQGIFYQEWRTMFLAPKPVIDKNGAKQDHKYYLDIMDRVVEQAKKDHANFIGAKLIYCVTRQFGPKAPSEAIKFLGVDWQVDNLIMLRKDEKYRAMLVGFDIVGEEDREGFNANNVYIDSIRRLLQETENSATYPFGLALHAGESVKILTPGSKAKENLEFAIRIKQEFPQTNMRIGHGVGLKFLPDVMELYDDLNIHVELCPLSNLFLGTNQNARDFATYGDPILKKLSCSYNGDDPTYQQSNPADEYMYAWSGNVHIDLYYHRAVGEMSIDAAFMTAEERTKAYHVYNQAWANAFSEEGDVCSE